MPDEFAPIGPSRPATADDLYRAMVAANAIVGKQRARIAELEAALRPFAEIRMIYIDDVGCVTTRINAANIKRAAEALNGYETQSPPPP